MLQGQVLQSQGLAQLPPCLHGDWENGALQPCHGRISLVIPLEAAGGSSWCSLDLDELLEALDKLGNFPLHLGLIQVFVCRCQGGTMPCRGFINPPG